MPSFTQDLIRRGLELLKQPRRRKAAEPVEEPVEAGISPEGLAELIEAGAQIPREVLAREQERLIWPAGERPVLPTAPAGTAEALRRARAFLGEEPAIVEYPPGFEARRPAWETMPGLSPEERAASARAGGIVLGDFRGPRLRPAQLPPGVSTGEATPEALGKPERLGSIEWEPLANRGRGAWVETPTGGLLRRPGRWISQGPVAGTYHAPVAEQGFGTEFRGRAGGGEYGSYMAVTPTAGRERLAAAKQGAAAKKGKLAEFTGPVQRPLTVEGEQFQEEQSRLARLKEQDAAYGRAHISFDDPRRARLRSQIDKLESTQGARRATAKHAERERATHVEALEHASSLVLAKDFGELNGLLAAIPVSMRLRDEVGRTARLMIDMLEAAQGDQFITDETVAEWAMEIARVKAGKGRVPTAEQVVDAYAEAAEIADQLGVLTEARRKRGRPGGTTEGGEPPPRTRRQEIPRPEMPPGTVYGRGPIPTHIRERFEGGGKRVPAPPGKQPRGVIWEENEGFYTLYEHEAPKAIRRARKLGVELRVTAEMVRAAHDARNPERQREARAWLKKYGFDLTEFGL